MGSRVIYKSKAYQLKEWHIADGRVHILTDSTAIIFNKSDVAEEIEKFESTQLPEVTSGNGLAHKSQDFKNLNSVEDVLMATMKEVKDNPGYVGQAKAINSSVSQLVNVQKVKIEMMKLHRKK